MVFLFLIIHFFFFKSKSSLASSHACEKTYEAENILGELEIQKDTVYCFTTSKGLVFFGQNLSISGEYTENNQIHHLSEKDNSYAIHFSTIGGTAKIASDKPQKIFVAQFVTPGVVQMYGKDFNFSTDLYINENLDFKVNLSMNSSGNSGRSINVFNPSNSQITIETDKNAIGVAYSYPSGFSYSFKTSDKITFSSQAANIQLIPNVAQTSKTSIESSVHITIASRSTDERLPILQATVPKTPTILTLDPAQRWGSLTGLEIFGIVFAVIILVAAIVVGTMLFIKYRKPKENSNPEEQFEKPLN